MYDTPLLTLAQEGATTETQQDKDSEDGTPDKSSGGMFGNMFFPLMIGAIVLMFVLTSSGQRKQKKKQATMIASMSKGAKVITMGGVKGSIVEVREDEVIVKVDESNNTRMHFTKDAIRTVLSDESD